jgi:phthalate 4,5-dioxygenase reductase component
MLRLKLASKQQIAADIHAFELRDAKGAELPAFTAGAHIPVRVPNGRMRRYSLCNDPAERDRYMIAVKREATGTGGSISLVDQSKVGDEIAIAAPRNEFELAANAPGYLFIAGGIGITPMRSMIQHLRTTGVKPFKLYYFTRSAEMTAFRDEFSARDLQGNVVLHHDGGDPANAFDLWPVLEQPKGWHLYCCGPKGLMNAVRDMTGHWSQATVHFEDFNAGDAKLAPKVDGGFEVKLARSGATHAVPAGKSILEVLRAAGHDLDSSCESGTCGTCETKLISGDVDHRDQVLGDDDRKAKIMICVSRARRGTLVLDL